MIKKSITYTDYNDQEVTEDFYFNFTKLEIAEKMELETEDGLEVTLEKLTKTNDVKGAYELFKKLILDAYGKKTEDGKRFLKSAELRQDFEDSPALSELVIEFLQNPNTAAAFVEGCLPAALINEVRAAQANQPKGVHRPPAQPVTPSPVTTPPLSPVAKVMAGIDEDLSVTGASDVRVEPAVPVNTGVAMSTAEKRQYTQEELDSIQGVPGTVPPEPTVAPMEEHAIEGEPSDEMLMAMRPQDMTPAQLRRAFQLKSTQQ